MLDILAVKQFYTFSLWNYEKLKKKMLQMQFQEAIFLHDIYMSRY